MIDSTNYSHVGQYDFTITYQLDPEAQNHYSGNTYCGPVSAETIFTVFLIEIIPNTPADMELAVGQPANTIQSITPWTVNPNTGGLMAWWDVELTVRETSGALAPSWIYYDSGTGEIVIDTALATTPGVYTFILRGEALNDESNSTGKYEDRAFEVVIYELSPSTVVDQIYPITTAATNY